MNESRKQTESTDIPAGEPFPEDPAAPEFQGEGPEGATTPAVEGPSEEAASEEAPPAGAPRGEPGPGRDVARDASILESLLLVADHPLSFEKIGLLIGGLSRGQVRDAAEALRAKYPPESSGILVEEVAKGLQLRTNPANQEYVRKFFDVKPQRFSRAALETLAVVAYKQPATRVEMEQVRQVDCAASLRTLMERRLVKVVGKKDVPGKPFLFGTTREFLEVFGLAKLEDLPSLREIEDFLAARTGTPVPDAPAASPGAEPFLHPSSELSESLEATGDLGEQDRESVPHPAVSDDVLAAAAGDEGVAEASELPDTPETRRAPGGIETRDDD